MDEKLKAIVQRMIDAGESEANIAKVIKAYTPVKKKDETTVSDGTEVPAGISLVSGDRQGSAPSVSSNLKGDGWDNYRKKPWDFTHLYKNLDSYIEETPTSTEFIASTDVPWQTADGKASQDHARQITEESRNIPDIPVTPRNYKEVVTTKNTYRPESGLPGDENTEYEKKDGQWLKVTRGEDYRPQKGEKRQDVYYGEVNDPDKIKELDKHFFNIDVESESYEQEEKQRLRKKELYRDIGQFQHKIGMDFIALDEDVAVPRLQRYLREAGPEYDIFKIEQTGAGYDAIIVTNKLTGEKKSISLDNSSERNKIEAEVLQGFIEYGIKTADYGQAKKNVRSLEYQLEQAKKDPTGQGATKQYALEEALQVAKNELKSADKNRRDIVRGKPILEAAMHRSVDPENIQQEINSTIVQELALKRDSLEKKKWIQETLEAYDEGRITEDEWKSKWEPQALELSKQIDSDVKEFIDNAEYLGQKKEDVESAAAAHYLQAEDRGSGWAAFGYSSAKILTNIMAGISAMEGTEFDQEAATMSISPGVFAPEYMTSEKRSDTFKLATGLYEFLGGTLVGTALTGNPTAGAFWNGFLTSAGSIGQEMNSDQFANIPKEEKQLLALLAGTAGGFTNMVGTGAALSKTPLGKMTQGRLNSLLIKTIKGAPKGASPQLIEQMLKQNIKTNIASRILTVGSASLVEGGEEVVQQLTESSIREVYNAMKERELFDTADGAEYLDQIAESFKFGVMGGAILNTGAQARGIYKNGFDDSDSGVIQYEILKGITTNEDLNQLYQVNLKNMVAEGAMTQEQADLQRNEVNRVAGIMNKIPEGVEQEVKAFNLIKEKQGLELKKIKGKEASLVVKEKARVAEIDTELQALSEEGVVELVKDESEPVKEPVTKKEVVTEKPVTEEPIVEEPRKEPAVKKDIDPHSFESAATKGIKATEEWLDTLDKKITDYGKKNLGMNIPAVVIQGAIKAAKVTAKTTLEVSKIIDSAINHLKKSDWYNKEASKKDQKKAVEDIKVMFKGDVKKVAEGSPERLKAISKAQNKFESTKKEGDKKLEVAVSDLQKSKWYTEATDIQRENAIRELRSNLGLKEKKGPSVVKLGIKPKGKKVTVSEKAALKEQIKLRARSAKEGAMSERKARKEIAGMIKAEMEETKGKYSPSQVDAIVQRALNLNLSSPRMADRFVDYVAKVVSDVDYLDKVKKAKITQKHIKAKSGNQKQQSNLAVMGKSFAKIDPSKVENITEYNEMASLVKASLEKSSERRGKVNIRVTANEAKVNAYTDKMLTKQGDLVKERLLDSYDSLVESGLINNKMSIEKIRDVIDKEKASDSSEVKEVDLRKDVEAQYNEFKEDIEEMLKTGKDPDTGERVSISKRQEAGAKAMTNIDISKLSKVQLFEMVDMLSNFAVNRNTSKVLATTSFHEGVEGGDKFASKNIPQVKSWQLTRDYVSSIGSIPIFLENVLGGSVNAIHFQNLSGFNDFVVGANKGETLGERAIEEYMGTFVKSKANGEHFLTAENIYERGMYAWLIRTVQGDEVAMHNEFERRVRIMKENIDYLVNHGTELERKTGKIYQKIAEKLGLDLNSEGTDLTVGDIESRVDPTNKKAVQWWIDKWAENKDSLDAISEDVYNKPLSSDLNYNGDFYKLRGELSTTPTKSELDQERRLSDRVHRKESSPLIGSKRPSSLPSNMMVNLDFDVNSGNSFKTAMVDLHTAASTRKLDGFLESDGFKKAVPITEDRKRIQQIISNYTSEKRSGQPFVSKLETTRKVEAFVNSMSNAGVKLALASVAQAPKQSLSVIFNTLANAGRYDAGMGFNSEAKKWMELGGVPEHRRGVESRTTMERAEKHRKKYSGKISTIKEGLKKADDFYLRQFLVAIDRRVATASFVSYYKQSLKKQGLSTSIDFDAPMNKDARDWAMHMMAKQQNVSDPSMAGPFWKTQETSEVLLRKSMFSLASFAMNQKLRMMTDMKTMAIKNQTKEQKKIAKKSLRGTVAEFVMYHGVSMVIGVMLYRYISKEIGYDDLEEDPWISKAVKKENTSRKLRGLDPMKGKELKKFKEEKEEEDMLERIYASLLTSAAKDFLSPAPVFDPYVIGAINKYLSETENTDTDEINKAVNDAKIRYRKKYRKDMPTDDERELRSTLAEKEAFQLWDFAEPDIPGTVGIALEKFMESSSMRKAADTGVIEDDEGRKKYLLSRDQEIMKDISRYNTMYLVRVAPADVGKATNNAYKKVKSRAFTKSQMNQYEELFKARAGSNKEGDALKKEIDANPGVISIEEEMMLRRGRNAAYVWKWSKEN